MTLFYGVEKRVLVTIGNIIKIYKILGNEDLEFQTNYFLLSDNSLIQIKNIVLRFDDIIALLTNKNDLSMIYLFDLSKEAIISEKKLNEDIVLI